jgi:hypothetical protein
MQALCQRLQAEAMAGSAAAIEEVKRASHHRSDIGTMGTAFLTANLPLPQQAQRGTSASLSGLTARQAPRNGSAYQRKDWLQRLQQQAAARFPHRNLESRRVPTEDQRPHTTPGPRSRNAQHVQAGMKKKK